MIYDTRALPWYATAYRRAVIDMHIPDWDDAFLSRFDAERYEIGGGGISLHWPELDEDLSIAGLMAGVDRESA